MKSIAASIMEDEGRNADMRTSVGRSEAYRGPEFAPRILADNSLLVVMKVRSYIELCSYESFPVIHPFNKFYNSFLSHWLVHC